MWDGTGRTRRNHVGGGGRSGEIRDHAAESVTKTFIWLCCLRHTGLAPPPTRHFKFLSLAVQLASTTRLLLRLRFSLEDTLHVCGIHLAWSFNSPLLPKLTRYHDLSEPPLTAGQGAKGIFLGREMICMPAKLVSHLDSVSSPLCDGYSTVCQ